MVTSALFVRAWSCGRSQVMGSDDEAAEFCAVVGPQIIGLLTLQCGDPDVAEDLAQQTLARLFMRWHRLRDVETCAPTPSG